MSRPPAGFSLLELLLVVVVLGLLASLAAPSWREAVHRARVEAALRTLGSDLYAARALAARSGRELVVRFEPPGAECVVLYALEDAALDRRLREVDLRREAPGVCLEVSGSPVLRIDARGMPRGAARKIRARLGEQRDSLTLSLVGRLYRWGAAGRWQNFPERQ